MISFSRRTGVVTLFAAVLLFASWPVGSQEGGAQEGGAEDGPPQDTVRIELNKLEDTGNACRAYLLFENATKSVFDALKLDLVMFGPDGVISKRLAVEGAPLPAGKTSVKLFDIQGLACAEISQILLNDIMACSDETGDRTDCTALVQPVALGDVRFIK